MINNEEDVLKVAKKFKLVDKKGYINKYRCPNPDVFPELLSPGEDKRTFIHRWFILVKKYNRKLRNSNNLKNMSPKLYHDELEKLEREKNREKHHYTRFKKGHSLYKPEYRKSH